MAFVYFCSFSEMSVCRNERIAWTVLQVSLGSGNGGLECRSEDGFTIFLSKPEIIQ